MLIHSIKGAMEVIKQNSSVALFLLKYIVSHFKKAWSGKTTQNNNVKYVKSFNFLAELFHVD